LIARIMHCMKAINLLVNILRNKILKNKPSTKKIKKVKIK